LALAADASPSQQGPEWQSVDVPRVGAVSVTVAKPSGNGPFRTIIILHGTHGFAAEYLDLARDLARHGVLAVAVCWFSGGAGEGRRFVTPLDCPAGTPAMPMADSDQAFATIDSVVAAVRAMPDSCDNQIVLFGHSRGGGAVRNYLLRGGHVQGGIMNSAGYDPSRDVSLLKAPILILHGTADSPADGGSSFTNVGQVRAFEAAVRAARKPVEAHYYRGGTHNGMFTDRRQRSDEVRRILRFMRSRLR
jgi:dienelactone hydrolase